MDKIKLELLKDVEGYIPPIIPIAEDDRSIIISKIFPALYIKDEIAICRQVDS